MILGGPRRSQQGSHLGASQPWAIPLPLTLVPTPDDDGTAASCGTTWLPLAPHPGAFGVRRAHHTHEGVDLYAPEGTAVSPVEPGVVVVIEPFTGASAGCPWWRDTWAVFVEGASGVVVYGEIIPNPELAIGQRVALGQILGRLTPVLRADKGRPMTMLHLELHTRGARAAPAWEDERPGTLQDPTAYLLGAVCNAAKSP